VSIELIDRAPIYAWLSGLLVREIDAETWNGLRAEPVRSLLTRLEPSLVASLERELTPRREGRLSEEFTRLFLLPGGVSPFAGVWLESRAPDKAVGQDSGESFPRKVSLLVERGFEALGREPIKAEPWGQLPLDHVSLLFDLISHGAKSTAPGDLEIALRLEHALLDGWLMPFGAALHERSREPIYRALGKLISSMGAVE
jgi:TorA maturation chaperone TorD